MTYVGVRRAALEAGKRAATYEILIDGEVLLRFGVTRREDGSLAVDGFWPWLVDQDLALIGLAVGQMLPCLLRGEFPEQVEIDLADRRCPDPPPAVAAVAGIPRRRHALDARGILLDVAGRFGPRSA